MAKPYHMPYDGRSFYGTKGIIMRSVAPAVKPKPKAKPKPAKGKD